MGVNPSIAGRTCDQLVATESPRRVPDPQDGRSTRMELTADGARFVAGLMTARRRLIEAVISRMSLNHQRALAQGLDAFMDAVETALVEDTIGLPDGRIIPWLM